MNSLLQTLKALIPVIEPLGEQGVNQLFSQVVDPYIASLPDGNDFKSLAICMSPALKQFVMLELQKLK